MELIFLLNSSVTAPAQKQQQSSKTSPTNRLKLWAIEQGYMELKLDSAAKKTLKLLMMRRCSSKKEEEDVVIVIENKLPKKLEIEVEYLLNNKLVWKKTREELEI